MPYRHLDQKSVSPTQPSGHPASQPLTHPRTHTSTHPHTQPPILPAIHPQHCNQRIALVHPASLSRGARGQLVWRARQRSAELSQGGQWSPARKLPGRHCRSLDCCEGPAKTHHLRNCSCDVRESGRRHWKTTLHVWGTSHPPDDGGFWLGWG